MKKNYEFLNNINFPSDLRKVSENNLQKVADEVREEMISAVSETGGHLGAGLGVVELTVALHYVFDTPNDKLIWDVGHQSYPHKILTGRKDKKKGKATLISLLGHKNTIKYANILIIKINNKLKKYGSKSKNLSETLEYILKRNK